MLSLKSCWSVSIKKSLIKQIRQTEKNDTPVRVEYYGNPKVRSTIIGNVTLEGKDVSRITTEVMQDGAT